MAMPHRLRRPDRFPGKGLFPGGRNSAVLTAVTRFIDTSVSVRGKDRDANRFSPLNQTDGTPMYGKIVTEPPRPSPELLKQFEGIWTSTISDAMGRHGVLDPDIQPLFAPVNVIGTALTVVNYPNDNITTHRALQMARPGDILVIDEGRGNVTGSFGHNMSLNARARGVVGLVSSGHVRDARLLREEQFPVFSRGVCPRSAQKNHPGAINVPVSVGGIVVQAGDIVIGDDDGVAVVPLAFAEEVLAKAQERQQMEHDQANGIRGGDQALGILYGENWAATRTADTLREIRTLTPEK